MIHVNITGQSKHFTNMKWKLKTETTYVTFFVQNEQNINNIVSYRLVIWYE